MFGLGINAEENPIQSPHFDKYEHLCVCFISVEAAADPAAVSNRSSLCLHWAAADTKAAANHRAGSCSYEEVTLSWNNFI